VKQTSSRIFRFDFGAAGAARLSLAALKAAEAETLSTSPIDAGPGHYDRQIP